MPSNNLSIVFTTSVENLPRKNFVTRNKLTSRITRNRSPRKYLLIPQQVGLIIELLRIDVATTYLLSSGNGFPEARLLLWS
jgi:hypothetical protein